ncbi:MAG: hypothetical protein GY906_30850 [bacterium]|nr:hypothetical protein [bacterium]
MKTYLVVCGVFTFMLLASTVGAQTPSEEEVTLPDLRVGALSTSPRQPCSGETTQIIVRLSNSGGSASGAFEVVIKIANERPIVVPIPGLPAKVSTTAVLEHTFVVGENPRVVVTVDTQGQVKEHDEENNKVALEVELTDC